MLTSPFRAYVLQVADPEERNHAFNKWITQVLHCGERVLITAADQSGDRGDALRKRSQVLRAYASARASTEQEWMR
jgi:hypothetical protein